MWIGGRRRGGADQLSTHLQKTDENESVNVRELSGFSFSETTGANLDKALKQMEAIGYGKGAKRNLYHVILAPAFGETLTVEQRKHMLDYYIEQMGFKDHQYALVEHWKKGKQHFHLTFNIIHPDTGKIHELKWTKRKEWQISRDLEQALGLKKFQPKGKAAQAWGMQRGKRTGLDPRKLRKEVTAIYHASMTTKDFVTLLDKKGLALTRGNRGQLVVVDQFGDTHGLMRLIEGKKLADLRRKFPELSKMTFKAHHELVKERKPAKADQARTTRTKRIFINPRHLRRNVRHAYRGSKTGTTFCAALHKHGYVLGRGLKSYSVIDANGYKYDLGRILGRSTAKGLDKTFPDLATTKPRRVSTIVRRLKTKKPAFHQVRQAQFKIVHHKSRISETETRIVLWR